MLSIILFYKGGEMKMYDQKIIEQNIHYNEEEIKQRSIDELQNICAPVIIDDIDTGYTISKIGILYDPKGNIVHSRILQNGYAYVSVNYMGKSRKQHKLTTIHRLVAIAFIPNPENKPQVNHKNSNRQDNWVGNLEWVTRGENMQHAKNHGFLDRAACFRVGEDRPNANYSNDQIHRVCQMLESGNYTTRDITKETGVEYKTIYSILHRNKWKFISSQYNIDFSKDYAPHYSDDLIHQICIQLIQFRSNAEIANMFNIPRYTVASVRNGKLRSDISSQYSIPQHPKKLSERSLSTDDIHKVCKLISLGVGPTEIQLIIPTINKGMIDQIRRGINYSEISSQYTFPPPSKQPGIRTGRVKPNTAKSTMVRRLGVGLNYDNVIKALENKQASTTIENTSASD